MEREINSIDKISDFVDSHEPELREIVGDLIDEDFFLDRLTENQECALRFYYVDCKTDEEIAEKLNIDLGEALNLQNSAVEEIMYLGRLCDIENILEEENLVEKLKKGQEEILEYTKYFEENYGKQEAVLITFFTGIVRGKGNKRSLKAASEKFGISVSKAGELLRISEGKFYSKWYGWKEEKQKQKKKKKKKKTKF